MKTTTKVKKNIKQEITKKIISSIEAGTIPWERPWNAMAGLPMNAIHRNPYRGGNILLLWSVSMYEEYDTDRWLTFNQIKTLAGFEWSKTRKGFVWPNDDLPDDIFHLRSGEKSSSIMTPMMVKRLDKNKKPIIDKITGKPEMVCIGFKGLPVFNVSQCDNIPEDLLKSEFIDKGPDSIIALNQLMEFADLMGVKIIEKGTRCGYSPTRDIILMSPRDTWSSADDFVATLAHELIHATGHSSRNSRVGITEEKESMDNPKYAYEELVAEIGASMICMMLGLQYKTRHASYIEGYLNVISEKGTEVKDKKFNKLFEAANEAQKGVDYLFKLIAVEDSSEVKKAS